MKTLKMLKKKAAMLISAIVCAVAVLSGCGMDTLTKDENIPPGSEITKIGNRLSAAVEGASWNGGSFLARGTNGSYLSVAAENTSRNVGSFLACGTSGRLDRIFADGTVENIPLSTYNDLTQVLVSPDIIIAGGYSGTLLYSWDGQDFLPCKGVDKSDILGLAAFNGKYYACTGNGSVLESGDGVSWKRNAKLGRKAIISISANDECLMAITAETDIHISKDGTNWDSQNFNDAYDGFYEKYTFAKLERIEEALYVLGYPKDHPDYPLVMYSDTGGELWMFSNIGEINDEPPQDFCPLNINSLCFFSGKLMAACNRGRIISLASCSVCNLLMTTPNADFRSIAVTDDNMLAVGVDYNFVILGVDDFRPDSITAEQALTDYEYGAVIIDLRDEDEYKQSHVKGCLHIPADKVEATLQDLVPDINTQLIFYCSTGADAQKSLETAQQLGYRNVYNLGAISNWPYETE